MAAKKRGLSEDDRQVWEQVKKTLIAKHPQKVPKFVAKPAAVPEVTVPRPGNRRTLTGIGRAAAEPLTRLDLAPDPMDRLLSQPHLMDKRTHTRMRKGKLRPEARLDLHGMFAQTAHQALIGFIRHSHGQGRRLVLVITGKGNTTAQEAGIMPTRNGVLRHALPQWLATPAMRPLILQITPAHARHGGGGAYYIYLKRNSRA